MRLKKKRFRKSLKTSPPSFVVEVGRRELLRRHAAGRVGTGREEVDTELLDGAAVDLGDADLQHHLLALRAAGQLQQVDDAGLARHAVGDLAGAQHDGVARHAAGEDDALVVHRDPDVFAGEELLERLLKRRHAGIDHDVGTDGARSRPTRSG